MRGIPSQANAVFSESIRTSLMHSVRRHALELVLASNRFGTREDSFIFGGQTFHIFFVGQTVNFTIRDAPQPSRIELTKQGPVVGINDKLRRPKPILAEWIVDICSNFL